MTDRHAQDDGLRPAEEGSERRARPDREVPPLAKLFQQEGWQLEGVSFGESVVEATASDQEVSSNSVPEPAPTQTDSQGGETTVIDVVASPAAVTPTRVVNSPPVPQPLVRTVDGWILRNPTLSSILQQSGKFSDGRETAGREVLHHDECDRPRALRNRIVEHVKQSPAAVITFAIVLLALGLVRFFASDGGAEVADLVSVSGTVSVNGKPLEDGVISFVSIQGGRTVAAKITDGRYSLPRNAGPLLGAHKVSVSAFRTIDATESAVADGTVVESGGTSEAVPADTPTGRAVEPVQVLPERYNSQTALRVELRSTVNKDVSFDLDSYGREGA